MDSLYAGLGRFVVHFRFLVVPAWSAIAIVCVAQFPSLSLVLKPQTFNSLLPVNAPSIVAAKLATPFFNPQYLSGTLVASRSTGNLRDADQAAFDRLERLVSAMPHVTAVHDLGVSPDGAARQAEVDTTIGFTDTTNSTALVTAIRKDFGQVSAPGGFTFHLTGQLASLVDYAAAAQLSQNAAQNLVYLLIIVLLLVTFRALLAPLLTLIPAALVLALSSPVIAGAVTRLNVPASSITQIVLIVLVLGAGTDYGLFLTFRVREEIRRGLAPKEAVVRAVETVGETITFSALTVMAALMTLAAAQYGVYQSLGPALAIGIGLMLLAGLTLVPALLAIFGRAVFWPTSTKPRQKPAGSLWGRLTRGLVNRPVVTLIVGIGLLLLLASGFLGTSLGGVSSSLSGPAGADSTVGTAVVNAHFPAATQNPASVFLRFDQPVWSHLDGLATAQQELSASSLVKTIIGPLDPGGIPLRASQLAELHTELGPAQSLPAVPPANSPVSPQMYELYQATAGLISADGRTVQFEVLLHDASSSPQAVAAIPTLRGAVDQASQNDLSHIIPLVAVLIAILLGLVLRSLVAPIYLVASVVLSFFAALGLTSLVFVRFGGQDNIVYFLPVVLFIFLMALGSDYNILVMRRIREEAQRQPLPEAVQTALAQTGGTVTSAGIILAGSFAVLAVTGGSAATSELGFGVAAGILMDTFLIRTLLIPALVILLGRLNWWPSPLSRATVLAKHDTAQETARR